MPTPSMNTLRLTDQAVRDISHALDAAIDDAHHYLRHHGETETEEELAELEATLERWKALAAMFDRLYTDITVKDSAHA